MDNIYSGTAKTSWDLFVMCLESQFSKLFNNRHCEFGFGKSGMHNNQLPVGDFRFSFLPSFVRSVGPNLIRHGPRIR